MNVRRLLCSLAAVGAFLLATAAALHAQNNPLITLQENGQGSLLFPGPGAIPAPTTGVLMPDPGPGGLASALTFNLLGPPSLVAGDLFIFELGTVVVSEVIRFNPAGTGPGYPASAVFYSAPGEGQPADTGFPTLFYTNTAITTEGANGTTTYTPTSMQPGFIPGFSVTYVLVSTAVPEPSTWVMVAAGLLTLVAAQRVRRRH